MVRKVVDIAGYGAARERAASFSIRDNGTMIAEDSTREDSNGVVGEIKAN